jgi:predicted dinucleotide-binding enzyme
MRISIIGAGNIGSAIAGLLSKAGVPFSIANSRGPESLTELVTRLGPNARAVTAEEASGADLVFLAVNWSKNSSRRSRPGPLERPDRGGYQQPD